MSDTQPSAQPVTERGNNRSQRPSSEAFRAFMADQWADTRPEVHRDPVADHTPARRERLSELFPGERLVLPAGGLVTRSNDTDYRFRPHSAFAHLTGLGIDQEPDAVLVLHPRSEEAGGGHDAVLYLRPMAGRDTEEFFADARYGEFWVGARPSLADLAELTGIPAEHLDRLADALAKDAGPGGVRLRVLRGVDGAVTALVEQVRADDGLTEAEHREADDGLTEATSELRLVKDE